MPEIALNPPPFNPEGGGRAVSQSPSLRGSGRFHRKEVIIVIATESLNPLHCGAVVASSFPNNLVTNSAARLNPLHCGAVVASALPPPRCEERVSSLNPLHCGAVVASLISVLGSG